jgi:hypothetical protein
MKGVPMKRRLLVLALFLSAAPAYSMTAKVTSATPPVAAPSTPDTSAPANSASKSGSTSAAPDTRPGAAVAAPGKAAPAAATVTRPAAFLSAPGIPVKSTAMPSARAGTPPSKASTPMPSAALQTAGSSAPSNATWAATLGNSAAMHRGTLQAINASAGTFNVFGQKLSFDAQRVKVFNRDGKPGTVSTLKSGANIRYTFDAADTQSRRVAVIYID